MAQALGNQKSSAGKWTYGEVAKPHGAPLPSHPRFPRATIEPELIRIVPEGW